MDHARIRDAYVEAADGLVTLVDTIDDDQWTRPGLGVWDVRATVAHAARAYLTTTRFFDEPTAEVTHDSAGDYYRAAFETPGIHDDVAARGVAGAAELGDDPAGTIRSWRDAAVAVVESSDGDEIGTVFGGGMRARAYLPTRIVELVVHSLDVARAVDAEPPDTPIASRVAVTTVAEMLDRTTGAVVLAALLGRGSLPEGFNLLA